MALSQISGTTGIANATITSIKLADFAAAVDLNGVELILDADQDTSITADTDDRIDFKIAGAEHISLSNSSGDTIIKPMADGKDIVFQQYDARKILEINDAGFVSLGNGGTGPGELRIYEDTDLGTNYSGFTVGNLTESYSLALPNADGSSGQALTTDGSGVLSFTTISTAYDDLTAGDAALNITTTAGNITIDAQGNDTDIIFKGTDGGSDRVFMTIDGSAGGDLFLTGGLIDLKNDGSAVSNIKFYCESSNAHAQTLIGAPHSESADNVLTLPGTGGDARLVSTTSTATLTNKTFTSPKINEDVAVTATATELNLLDGVSGLVQADLTKLAAIDATATEINLIDGGATVGTTAIADGDGLLINDAGTMRVSTVQTLAAYLDDEITAMPNLVTTAATTVGALDSGSITSGFTSIDVGAGAITTTGTGTIGNLVVDDVAVNGKVITMTGSSGDTFVTTVAANGATSLVTTDASAAAAHLTITADGTVDINSAGVLTLDSGAAINIEPASGSAILLDGTISIDAGVVTGATSVTSTAFVGNLTGTVATATQNSITTATGLTTVGATGTQSAIAGIPFYSDGSTSLYTHNVSGTDDTANYNTAIGYTALDAVTTGDSNTAMGYAALGANNAGYDNVAIGHNALLLNTGGHDNVAIGNGTLDANTTGNNNTAIGRVALGANTTGDHNLAIGQSALSGNTTGTRNTAIGYQAYTASDTENDNLAIGYQAMTTDTAGGTLNVAIGNYALDALTSGDNNVAVGQNALGANTTGNNNTGVGYNTLVANTTGGSNVALGAVSLSTNTDGANNTGVGYAALKLNSTGARNTGFGRNALTANTTANDNVAVGDLAMNTNTTGANNVAVGAQALEANTTASDNVAVGYKALEANTTGGDNIAIGSQSLLVNTTGGDNVSIGTDAMQSNTTGADNVAIGKDCMLANTEGVNNVAMGNISLIANTTGSRNTAIGAESMNDNTTADNNTAIGYASLSKNTTGTSNTAIGWAALEVNTTSSNNVAVGHAAARSNTTGERIIAIGYGAYDASDTEDDNIAIGYNALTTNTAGGVKNVMIGNYAGDALTSADDCVGVGYAALGGMTSGISCTGIGWQAGINMVGNQNSSCFGYNAQPSSNSVDNEITFGDGSVSALRCNDQSIAALSDGRDKTDVVDLPHGLDFINQTRPVRFKWDIRDGQPGQGKQGTTNYGFIAQELLEIGNNKEHRLVYESNPDKLEARYSNLIPMMAKAIQELSAKVDAQQSEIDALKNA